MFGSGDQPEPRSRRFLGELPHVNINALAKAGALVPGTALVWKYPSSLPLTMASRAEPTRLFFSIGGTETAVEVVQQDRHFGGSQSYFVCRCGALRQVLHVLGDRLVCRGRDCGNLMYRCRYKRWWPVLHRAVRIRRRYSANPEPFGPLPAKPAKCRHATHARLIAELIACENQARAVVGGMLSAMEQRRRGMERHATRKKPKSRSATDRAADRRRRPDVQS